jgi:hypothetical protein
MKSMKLLAASSAFLALAACGGGGGGGGAPVTTPPVVTVPPITLAQLQGFWNGPISGASLGGASTARSVVLSDGSAWLFLHDAQDNLIGLSTAKLAVSGQTFSASGARYPSSGAKAESITVTGAAPTTTTFAVTVASGTGNSNLALTADTRYTTAATRADVTGNWQFTKAGATIVANWAVDANGVLSGTSTLGCTYNGTVAPHGTVAVYDVALTETCTASTTQLTGIAKLNTAKTFLTFGLTTTDGAKGEAIVAQKM